MLANFASNQHPSSFLLLIDALIDENNCLGILVEILDYILILINVLINISVKYIYFLHFLVMI